MFIFFIFFLFFFNHNTSYYIPHDDLSSYFYSSNLSSYQLSQNLTNTTKQLAYQNYAQERARQEAAASGAPQMAMADYGDISKLLGVGQLGEQYQQAAYAQPQQALNAFLAGIQGLPMGTTGTSTTPQYYNPTAQTASNIVGAAGAAKTVWDLGKDFGWWGV